MKLLIASNCDYPIPMNLEQCKTRNELFIYLFKIILENFDNMEVVIAKCYPYLDTKDSFKKFAINVFPQVDHVLFIDDYGFHGKHQTFINQLRKHTTHSISSLLYDTKFSNLEDITFTFNNKQCNNKTTFIKPPLDEYIYVPRKDKNIIYILLSKPSHMMHLGDTNISFILSKIDKLILKNDNCNIIFKIGIIDHKTVNLIDTRGTIIETKKFDMYIDFVYEISKANIFILSNKIVDLYLLYELAMCNTLIISKMNVINKYIVDELKIYTYNEKFKWDDIFNALMTYNTRQFLLTNDYSWTNMLNTIIDKMKKFEETNFKIKEIPNNNKIINKFHNKIHILNIAEKSRPQMYDMNEISKISNHNIMSRNMQKNQTDTQKNQTDKKLPIFLQSQLLK